MRTVDDFLLSLPEDEKKIVAALRKIIHSATDRLTEKLSYGVPYFYQHRRVCFTWPASCGAAGIEKGVILGFCNGHLLSNDNGLLDGRGRKVVWDVIYDHPSQIEPERIRETLREALLVDEEIFRTGKNSGREKKKRK